MNFVSRAKAKGGLTMPKKTNFQIRNLDPDLHKRARVMSLERGIPLNTIYHQLIRKEVERYEREKEG